MFGKKCIGKHTFSRCPSMQVYPVYQCIILQAVFEAHKDRIGPQIHLKTWSFQAWSARGVPRPWSSDLKKSPNSNDGEVVHGGPVFRFTPSMELFLQILHVWICWDAAALIVCPFGEI